MPIVTLISDFGNGGYHVAATKGVLLSTLQDIHIVDITHSVQAHNYIEAAFILSNCFRDFPEGTVHLIGIEGAYTKKNEWIIAQLENHIFITKNNGILSLISSEKLSWCYLINIESATDLKFPFKNLVAKTAAQLLSGKKPNELGIPFFDLLEYFTMEPMTRANSIYGQVMHITLYNNVVTNIHQKVFNNFAHYEKYKIYYNRTETLSRICNSYLDVAEGAAACFFGETGYLELAINKGNAFGLLSLEIGKKIIIEFE